MPPYQNESLHDMHGLLQKLDTLNAVHAPEHLEMFSFLADAKNSATKAWNDHTLSTEKKATDEEVIVHLFLKNSDLVKKSQMQILLDSKQIQTKYDELLRDMLKSSTFKEAIMTLWYPKGILEETRTTVYTDMHPPKSK